MKLVIHGHHLSLPRDVASFLRKHVTTPLARIYDDPAAQLTVHLDDMRLHRGGVDQACRLTFRMPRARTLQVESVADDLYKSLLDASERLKRLVQRQIQKRRSPARRITHRPLGRTYRGRASRRVITDEGYPSTL